MSPPGDRREPLADTKCPPAAQRKQAKRACEFLIPGEFNQVSHKTRVLLLKRDLMSWSLYVQKVTFRIRGYVSGQLASE